VHSALVDIQERRGVKHLRMHGKGSKIRYVPMHPGTTDAIVAYLEAAGHGDDKAGALYRPTSNNTRSRTASTNY
jgi:integrase/recombinase XerD